MLCRLSSFEFNDDESIHQALFNPWIISPIDLIVSAIPSKIFFLLTAATFRLTLLKLYLVIMFLILSMHSFGVPATANLSTISSSTRLSISLGYCTFGEKYQPLTLLTASMIFCSLVASINISGGLSSDK